MAPSFSMGAGSSWGQEYIGGCPLHGNSFFLLYGGLFCYFFFIMFFFGYMFHLMMGGFFTMWGSSCYFFSVWGASFGLKLPRSLQKFLRALMHIFPPFLKYFFLPLPCKCSRYNTKTNLADHVDGKYNVFDLR